jgi:predicted DNA-binding transcriptional regulator AlpA
MLYMAPIDTDALLTPSAVTALTTIPESTLAQYRSRGGGPRFIKLGRKVLYRAEDVQRWISEHARTSTRGDAA